MYTVNKYLSFNMPKNLFSCLKRYSSHFVYHPENVLNDLGVCFTFNINISF